MTPDERIEKLLNRAGQTISDLPKATNYDFAYTNTDYALTIESVQEFECCEDITTLEFADYILHLTDIIDRMETALENVIGERDYLAKHIKKSAKPTCAACAYNEVPLAHDPCRHCSFGIVEAFKFARVPTGGLECGR